MSELQIPIVPIPQYKSKIVSRNFFNDNGQKVSITEKIVVYWDKHFADRQRLENKSFLDFLQKLIASPENFRITSTQSKAVRKFLKKEFINKKTGDPINASDIRAVIDTDKVKEYRDSMGFYQIVSSELNRSEKNIIDIYHGLSRIEDQFRVMKGDLSTRPMHVNTPEHIEAHLTLCVIALTVIRIIQTKINTSGLIEKTNTNWTSGLSAERIQRALNKWTVEKIADDYYRFNHIDDPDLKLILDAFNINIPKKLFKISELKHIKTSIKITN